MNLLYLLSIFSVGTCLQMRMLSKTNLNHRHATTMMLNKLDIDNLREKAKFMNPKDSFSKLNLEPTTAASFEAQAPDAKRSPTKTFKKLFPLGAMLFFILFNYTILRDTKDVLVVTAPNSGAEIIPFLKTYVNLPAAIGFTILYSALCNKLSPDKVFYLVMSSFVTFFGAFATVICKLFFLLLAL